jgi:hypothetical protein
VEIEKRSPFSAPGDVGDLGVSWRVIGDWEGNALGRKPVFVHFAHFSPLADHLSRTAFPTKEPTWMADARGAMPRLPERE